MAPGNLILSKRGFVGIMEGNVTKGPIVGPNMRYITKVTHINGIIQKLDLIHKSTS